MLRMIVATSAIALALAGCTSTLPPPDNMRVTSLIADKSRCTLIGPVKGDEIFADGPDAYAFAERSANAKMMIAAAKMGADTVEVQKSETGYFGGHVSGQAYRCSP